MGSASVGRVKLALFGLGRMGTIHIENMVKNHRVHISYLVDVDLKKACALKNEYFLDHTKIVSDEDSSTVFEDETVDGVVICTPTDTHAPLVLAAIRAGKGVLCEKPLALTIQSTIQCYEEAEKYSVPLLCAFNRRFDPQLREMFSKRHIIGNMHSIKTCSRDSPRPPMSYIKISGKIFHDCAVHDLDMLRWMVGEEPETIYSVAHAHIPEIADLDDVDTVYIVLKFPSGVIAHVDLARDCKYGYHQTCEVFGERGNLMSDNPSRSALHSAGSAGEMNDVIHFSFKQRYAAAYTEEISHFVELLTSRTSECCIKAGDTLRATFLAQAAEDSWRTGQIVDLKSHFKLIFGEQSDNPLLH